jgi:hypothetical protein
MKSLSKLDSVGWGFWGICFIVFLGPCIYVGWILSNDYVESSVRVLIGITGAAMVAGVISWVVNDQLHRRKMRRIRAERESLPKAKKKKKKKKK